MTATHPNGSAFCGKQNECHDVCVIFGCVYKVVVPKAAALAIVQDAQGSMPQSVQALNVRATDCTSKSVAFVDWGWVRLLAPRCENAATLFNTLCWNRKKI